MKGLSFLTVSLLISQCFAQETVGFDPTPRSELDTAAIWTMVQIKGFATDGVIKGFNVYTNFPTSQRPLILGLYRPVAGVTCKFTLLKYWKPDIAASNTVAKIIFSSSDQFEYKAGDTIGYTWTNYGIVPFNYVSSQNYCEEAQQYTTVGGDVALVANRHGGRAYSFQAITGPAGSAQQTVGFDPTPRSVVDTAAVWTMVQIKGFATNGVIKGFNVYTNFPTSQRPLILGLYRPVAGVTCKFTLLKYWKPDIAASNTVTKITFSSSDQFEYKAGDTIGYTWTNYGIIPFDYVSTQNYCEEAQQYTTVGGDVALVANRHGGRAYSFQAITSPPFCPAQQTVGFDPTPRSVVDTAALWTMVQIKGFATDGVIKGFNVYTNFPTSQRPLILGLYRPVAGVTCKFTLLKYWKPDIAASNTVTKIIFSGSDQFEYKAGDTIGYTWTNYGTVPFEYVSTQNYCEEAQQYTTVGGDVALVANRHGGRAYSFQAITGPLY